MTNHTRREFLRTTAAAAGAVGLGFACGPYEESGGDVPAPMSILILGGTGFIGPHMVRYAASRGHTVTLFNRGRTNTHLFPDLEKLVGDRDGDSNCHSMLHRKDPPFLVDELRQLMSKKIFRND